MEEEEEEEERLLTIFPNKQNTNSPAGGEARMPRRACVRPDRLSVSPLVSHQTGSGFLHSLMTDDSAQARQS